MVEDLAGSPRPAPRPAGAACDPGEDHAAPDREREHPQEAQRALVQEFHLGGLSA